MLQIFNFLRKSCRTKVNDFQIEKENIFLHKDVYILIYHIYISHILIYVTSKIAQSTKKWSFLHLLNISQEKSHFWAQCWGPQFYFHYCSGGNVLCEQQIRFDFSDFVYQTWPKIPKISHYLPLRPKISANHEFSQISQLWQYLTPIYL